MKSKISWHCPLKLYPPLPILIFHLLSCPFSLPVNPVSAACLSTCMCFLSFVSADFPVLWVRLLTLSLLPTCPPACASCHLSVLTFQTFFHIACLFCLFFYPLPSIAFLTAISFPVCLAGLHCKEPVPKFETNIPRKGIARPQSQFPH